MMLVQLEWWQVRGGEKPTQYIFEIENTGLDGQSRVIRKKEKK